MDFLAQHWLAIAIVAVIVVSIIALYNGLIGGEQAVKNSWSQITVQLKRRHDLIPNLLETVKGAADFEKSTLQAVTNARTAALQATNPADSVHAEAALGAALSRFTATAEAYPQLRATEEFGRLMEELSATENKIAFSRQAYNDAVESQNSRILSFPGVLVARQFGFTPHPMFEVSAEEAVAIQAVPSVKF